VTAEPVLRASSGNAIRLTLDLGRCLFCNECVNACPTGAIQFTSDHRMAATRREDLVVDGGRMRLAQAIEEPRRRLLRRSLKLRQVSAGGSAGCELEAAALGNVVFDAGRFGVEFVASPRHADGLLVTGPVTANMLGALQKTYQAIPPPKVVIAAGAASISGGPFAGNPEVKDGIGGLLPVDLYIPGHPPHPLTILDGILRLLGRLRGT
jgi:Ni,Fe-hydrogenase III small subunit